MKNTPHSSPHKAPAPVSLIDAVKDGDLVAVRNLLNQGSDVNEADSDGDSALSCAARLDYTDIARLLIEKGAPIDSRNIDGDTPLMAVIYSYGSSFGGYYSQKKEDIIRLLLEKGASLDLKNNDGATALNLAKDRHLTTVVKILKETAEKRERLAAKLAAQHAEDKRRALVAQKQQRLRDLAKHKPKPPKAA